MTAFFGGLVFGAIITGAVIVAFINRARRDDLELEEWEDPFADPPPLEIRTTISKRHYSL